MTDEALNLPNTPRLNSNTVWSASDSRVFVFVRHWRCFEELMAGANNKDLRHKPAQKALFKRMAYKVGRGPFEAICANMPAFSLAAAGEYRSLREVATGHDRMGDPKAS